MFVPMQTQTYSSDERMRATHVIVSAFWEVYKCFWIIILHSALGFFSSCVSLSSKICHFVEALPFCFVSYSFSRWMCLKVVVKTRIRSGNSTFQFQHYIASHHNICYYHRFVETFASNLKYIGATFAKTGNRTAYTIHTHRNKWEQTKWKSALWNNHMYI